MITLDILTLAQQGPGGMNPLFLMVLMFAILYFMMIRPQQRKEKARRAMIKEIKSGDRVVFGGGIIGQISNVKESSLSIKIADNVKIEAARGSVTRVLEKGEAVGEEDAS